MMPKKPFLQQQKPFILFIIIIAYVDIAFLNSFLLADVNKSFPNMAKKFFFPWSSCFLLEVTTIHEGLTLPIIETGQQQSTPFDN